jgi:hypothetical protein
VRECISGEVLLARSLLGGTSEDLKPLLEEVANTLPVPIKDVISDGQHAIRKAVGSALPGVVPHQLCVSSTICVRRPRRSTRPTVSRQEGALKKRVCGG